MMSKCSIFVSAISSSTVGGNDLPFAESTLSVFGCGCVCWRGGGGGDGGVGCDGGVEGGGGSGGGDDGWSGGGGDVVEAGDGDGDNGGSGSCDGVGGGDCWGRWWGWGECFDGLFMELPLEVRTPSPFPDDKGWDLWSRNAPVLLY